MRRANFVWRLVAGCGLLAMSVVAGATSGLAPQPFGAASQSAGLPAAPRGAPGSWSVSVAGPVLMPAAQPQPSALLHSTISTGRITAVGWQVASLLPPPAGLRLFLCDAWRCAGVGSALRGTSMAFAGDGANTDFQMIFLLEGSARQRPASGWPVREIQLNVGFE